MLDLDLYILQETTAEEPMDKIALINAMKTTFTAQELKHITIGAGSALVFHGAKEFANDADCMVDSLDVLKAIAKRTGSLMSKSVVNGAPRVEVDGWAELFYDPETYSKVFKGVPRRSIVINGLNVDSVEASVAWYNYMVKVCNRPKDHDNLAKILKVSNGLKV